MNTANISLLNKWIILLMTWFMAAPLFGADYDVIIKNGTVYDGLGNPGQKTDIAIKNKKISGLGDFSKAAAGEVIDAAGLIVAPGFIDIHTHSDVNPFLRPDSPHRVLQGITSEVTGNCGMSAAPLFDDLRGDIRQMWLREGVTLPEDLITWRTLPEYFDGLEKAGMNTNFIPLLAHGNIRRMVMGNEARQAADAEIKQMTALLEDALEQGAAGMSLGLSYIPGTYAGEKELLELSRVLARRGALLAVHMRSEGKGLIPALQEVLALAEKTGVRLEISHLKAAAPNNWSKIEQAFQLIEEARARGIKVTADVYPYEAAFAELGTSLPDEIFSAPNRLELVSSIEKREEIKKTVAAAWERDGMKPDMIMIAQANLPEHEGYQGKTLKEIGDMTGQDPIDVMLDLLAKENFQVSRFSFSQNPEIVSRVIKKEYTSIGSDNVADFGAVPHPRVYGTFPRVFEKWVREEKSLSLAQAIYKMTGLPAAVLGLKNRGRIAKGAAADIVIFDLNTMKSPATYAYPDQYAEGFRYVFVNGQAAVREGKSTGTLAGKVLR